MSEHKPYARRKLELTPEEQAELERVRDHNPRPYLRERAAALLKIAQGQTPHQVARQGLLKPRDPDSVYAWLNAYKARRTLTPRLPCRGAFSPRARRGGSANRASQSDAVRSVSQSLDASAAANQLPAPEAVS